MKEIEIKIWEHNFTQNESLQKLLNQLYKDLLNSHMDPDIEPHNNIPLPRT
uniref:Uncharacterized protein n=1 Tax=Rhizophagus irregularis (strain DAOM 181602 / DAOM 197198 / MUCL 43194) TaxID=747089 RepID=U9UCG8_RHIID